MKLMEISNFCLLINQNEMIKNLSFSIQENKIYGIKAENGRGKTSLLDFICDTFHKNKDYDYTGTKISKENLSISRVFQEPRFINSISVEKNIMLSAGKNPDKIKYKKLINDLNIKDCCKKNPLQLSGGQLQRASIARALYHPFDLLLLDEPFSFQDEENHEFLIYYIKKYLAEKNAACILISHDEKDFEKFNAELLNIKI